jgi:alpha-1,3-rhamnosyltransferase
MNVNNENKVSTDLLVSIIVITYNSSKYVIETLESAKNQSYKNIELIISDDCSTDNTIALCTQWLEENKAVFVNIEIITTEVNTGIPANCNRGVKSSKGHWIKLIAGDDILKKECVTLNINHILKNDKIKIVFSNCELFQMIGTKFQSMYTQPKEEQKKWFNCDAESQYLQLLKNNFNWTTPTSFINRSFLKEIDLYDERFPFFEDYPLWLKITKKGFQLYYFDEITVLYRQSASITRVDNKWMNQNYFKSLRSHFKLEVSPNLKLIDRKIFISKKLYFFKMSVLVLLLGNKKSILARGFNRSFQCFFNVPNL